ncbi:hypothetical protein N7539_002625 [Penicillium diatomitis]|uniref:Uncharacterized protein n=1 Tax=Penicillium diatomitis TaxID=2819901 RepID=A0A9W9XFM8_9EURO|nr:uncharacterized protein N7539_002625 [Penicillium diatomitis]KAJ5491058.1 hypothetical protein N7539_002625 [Penicillium diatomitis]
MGQMVKTPTGTAPNSTLSKRRRFQPPITSFFSAASAESGSSDAPSVTHDNYSATTFSSTPVLPEKVQRNLMQVGARVRKSMAEGYKTQLSMKAEKLHDTVTPAEPRVASPSLHQTSNHISHTPRRAELAPFSGFSKTMHDPYSVMTDDGDAYSLPPSSQESMLSTDSYSGNANGQKRGLDFEDDASPQGQSGAEAWTGRVYLSPRGRLSTNISPRPSGMDVDDFEEASFLRQQEEVDQEYGGMEFA